MKKLLKVTAIILALAMLAQSTPLSRAAEQPLVIPELTEEQAALAATGYADVEENRLDEPVEHLAEDESLRTENAMHIKNENRSNTVLMYPFPIHFRSGNGPWQRFDNTLVLDSSKRSAAGKAMYAPAASGLDTRIPQEFAQGQMVTVGKDGYTVGLGVSAQNEGVQLEKAAVVVEPDDLLSNNLSAEMTARRERTKIIPDDFVGPLTRETQVALHNETFTELKNLTSAVAFEDILPDTDFEWIVTSLGIKGNVVVKAAREAYEYIYDLSLGGLTPVPQEDGSIALFVNISDEEPLFALEAPYMYDAAEKYSTALTMTLAGDGTLTLTADAEWINAEERVLPVVIDPTLKLSKNTGIHDVYVDSTLIDANFTKTGVSNFVGTYVRSWPFNNEVRRTYIKFDLPDLPDGSIVLNAALAMQQRVSWGTTDNHVVAYDCIDRPWKPSGTGSVTWNNQPFPINLNNSGITALDYASTNTSNWFPLSFTDYFYWNVTKAAKRWYEDSTQNNGIMFAMQDESVHLMINSYSSRANDNQPFIEITYMNNTGLEGYWDYETIDMGRSGTAFVNDYNGELTYVHSDIALSGQLLPLNISHVYNSSRDTTGSLPTNMVLGTGFSLNLLERIVAVPSGSDLYTQGYEYKLIDGDGTVHYFKKTATNKYAMEFNSTVVLTVYPSGSYKFAVTDSNGNEKRYHTTCGGTTGYLVTIIDRLGQQTIAWSSGRIDSVTDGANRTAAFTYNGYNQLTSIKDPSNRSTAFAYSSTSATADLTSITYPDAKSTGFQYTGSYPLRGISRINVFDGTGTAFTYKSITSFSKTFHRVATVTSHEKTTNNSTNTLTFTYFTGMTRIADSFGRWNEYIFDNAGNTVNVRNQDGQAAFALYNSGGNKNNTPSMTSTTQVITTNLIKDPNMERTNYWAGVAQGGASGSTAITTTYPFRGAKSLNVTSSNSSGTYGARYTQDIPVDAGEVYTLSAYVLTPGALTGAGSAKLGYDYLSGGTWITVKGTAVQASNTWDRYAYTFTVPGGVTAIRPHLMLDGVQGTVYFDAIALERSGGANPYNLVDNSGFSETSGTAASYWTMYNTQSGDGAATETVEGVSRKIIKMTGSPTQQKRITQRVALNAKAGETVIFGGKAMSKAVGTDGDDRKFAIVAEIYNASNVKIATESVPFRRDVHGYYQMAAGSYTLSQDAAYLDYSFVYYNQLNEARFADAFVYSGNFSFDYSYDPGSGLLTKIASDDGKAVTVAYNGNGDVTNISQVQDGQVLDSTTITYDNQQRVQSTTDGSGITTSYTYLNGTSHIVTGVTTQNGSLTTSESITYTTDNNYVATYKDARGGVSTYTYNLLKGLMTSAKDPKNNTITYVYDPNNDALTSTTGNASPSMPVTTGFAYQNGSLNGITRSGGSTNSTGYGYTYDNMNRVTAAKVGSNNLATNTYDSRHRLATQTYANGAVYAPVYDSRDRFAGEKWNGTQTSAYYYNDNNQLSMVEDKITGISQQYNYDLAGRASSVIGSDGSSLRIGYDAKSAPDRLTYSQNGATIFDAGYASDNQGRVTGTTLHSMNNSTLGYTYDALNRPTRRDLNIPAATLRSTVTYVPGTSGNATGLVSQYKNEKVGKAAQQEYNYSYDANGNITNVNEVLWETRNTSYTYDGLNRLTSETGNGAVLGYNYDPAGNLTSVTKNGATLDSYVYGNANWTDQLTEFNGKAITYDGMGNPLSYDGQSYNWQKGRQLAGITNTNGQPGISYAYDASGRRTSKTVGGVITNYTYAGGLLVRQSDGTNTLDFAYDASGTAVGFKHNGTPYFYLRNVQGDVTGITNASGVIVAEYTYDAWGNVTILEAPLPPEPPTTTTAPPTTTTAPPTTTTEPPTTTTVPTTTTTVPSEPEEPEPWEPDRTLESDLLLQLLTDFGLEGEDADALLDLILKKDILNPAKIAPKLLGYLLALLVMFMEPEELEELDLGDPDPDEFIEVAGIMVGWLGNMASLSQTIGEDIYPIFLEQMLTHSADDILLLLEDFEGLLEEYNIEMPELSPLEGLFFALSLVAVALPALYYADVITALRDEIPQLIQSLELDPEPEFDLDELLEAILLFYIENTEDIMGAYEQPEEEEEEPTTEPPTTAPSTATTTTTTATTTTKAPTTTTKPARPAEVAYNLAIAELNPIRYRGYYRDAETEWYFCQTRYYNPQWRRWINADCMFVAGDDLLCATNLYAYCNGNPVMYCDPSGMAVVEAVKEHWKAFWQGCEDWWDVFKPKWDEWWYENGYKFLIGFVLVFAFGSGFVWLVAKVFIEIGPDLIEIGGTFFRGTLWFFSTVLPGWIDGFGKFTGADGPLGNLLGKLRGSLGNMFNPESEGKLFTGKFLGALKDLWERLKEWWGGTTVLVTNVTVICDSGNTVAVNETVYPRVEITPTNAKNPEVQWSVTNTAGQTGQAEISPIYGALTGVKEGKVTVTATAKDGSGEFGTMTFTVTPAPVTEVSITGGVTVLNAGGTTQWSATITPSNAANKTIVWNYSNVCKLACTVPCTGSHGNNGNGITFNQSGLITAVSAGIAVRITATAHNGVQGARSVQVNALTNTAHTLERAENHRMSQAAQTLLDSRNFDWVNSTDTARRTEVTYLFDQLIIILGIANDPPTLDIGTNYIGLGAYFPTEHEIRIDETNLNDSVICYILFHEMRHAYQGVARRNAGSSGWGSVTSTTLAWWDKDYARNIPDDGYEAHVSNPREWDARQFASERGADRHWYPQLGGRNCTPLYFGQWFVSLPNSYWE